MVLIFDYLIFKVKGYINEMAVRLEDEDDRISNLAKLFFHELSKKGEPFTYSTFILNGSVCSHL